MTTSRASLGATNRIPVEDAQLLSTQDWPEVLLFISQDSAGDRSQNQSGRLSPCPADIIQFSEQGLTLEF